MGLLPERFRWTDWFVLVASHAGANPSDRSRRPAWGLSRWRGEHTSLFEAEFSRVMGFLPERFRWTDRFVLVASHAGANPRDYPKPLARGQWVLPIRSRLRGLWRGWHGMVPPV